MAARASCVLSWVPSWMLRFRNCRQDRCVAECATLLVSFFVPVCWDRKVAATALMHHQHWQQRPRRKHQRTIACSKTKHAQRCTGNAQHVRRCALAHARCCETHPCRQHLELGPGWWTLWVWVQRNCVQDPAVANLHEQNKAAPPCDTPLLQRLRCCHLASHTFDCHGTKVRLLHGVCLISLTAEAYSM